MATYIKATCKEFGQYWQINISFKIEDLQEFENEKWYINLVLQKRKEIWKYWETHNLILNDWKPKEKEETMKKAVPDPFDDLPF